MRLVHFSRDFPPYGKKAGEYRLVSDNVVERLMNEYQVVDNAWKNLVLIKPLKRLDIKGYMPYNTGIMDIETALKYIEAGDVVVVDDGRGNITQPQGRGDPGHVTGGYLPKFDPDRVNAHWPSSNGESYPRLHIRVQLSLWLQSSDRFADDLIDRMVEAGYWELDNGNVRRIIPRNPP